MQWFEHSPFMVSTIFSSTTQSQDVVLINRGFLPICFLGSGFGSKNNSKQSKQRFKKKMQLKKAVVTETQTSPLFYTEFNKQRSKRLFSALTVQECLAY